MILDLMNTETAKKIQAIIGKLEEKVTHYTMQKILRFPPDTRIGYVQNNYPKHAREKDVIMYIYVVDEPGVLPGVIDLKELLQAGRPCHLTGYQG